LIAGRTILPPVSTLTRNLLKLALRLDSGDVSHVRRFAVQERRFSLFEVTLK
jgi:hypothetical protein